MNMLKTILATAIVATSASAMAAKIVSPAAALKAQVKTIAAQTAEPAQAKVEAVKAEANVKATEKAEKKGFFSWFKKAA